LILLNAHQIAKSFADKTLFENVSFGIEEKERIGLVGPNGAGKSTLLKILAGQMEPEEGRLARKKGLRIGFLEQTPEFLEGATVLSATLEKSAHPDEDFARALEILAHLDLTRFEHDFQVSQLSGGWKKRVALARELTMEPELLILDEPTNHLDITSILWLEEYLNAAPYSVLMVTHDRLFLQRTTKRIMDLDPRNPNYMLCVDGDYSTYLEAKEHELAALQRHERVEKNRLRRETEWLRRGSQARQTKQSARIESALALGETVQDLKSKNRNRKVDLEFGEAGHSPRKLIEATGIGKSYDDRTLFKDLDLLVTPKTRLGILGDNGTGKSTLIKALLGLEKPDHGCVKPAERLEIAYFEQSRETLDHSKSVLKNLCPEGDYVTFQGVNLHVRSYLDRFFFSGHKAELPVGKLSGGEQARLRIAQLMLKQAQLLVLDEPTNDLDSDTLDSLAQSLDEFSGAVILVTHDRYFLDAVANQILAFPPAAFPDRSLQKFANYFQWETWFNEENKKLKVPEGKKGGGGSQKGRQRLSFKEKFELENMEATIQKVEAELETLNVLCQSADVVANHNRLGEILSQVSGLQLQIEELYQRWSELELKK
jgi:ATP-binding cassette subfamily F protein uup